MRRIAVLACLPALLLTACGGDGATAGDDPASLAPANVPIYFEAVIRPEGDLREDFLAAAGKVLDAPEPEARLRELVDMAFEGQDVDYERDLEPWLGERLGFWVSDLAADEPVFGLVAQTDDTEQALATIEASAEREGDAIENRSHAGIDYLFDPDDDTAAGAVEDFIVIATERELKRAIDTADGDSLAETERYGDALDALPDERIASFYVDQRLLVQSFIAAAPEGEADMFGTFFDVDEIQPVAGAVIADEERIAIDLAGTQAGNKLDVAALSGEATPLLGELPGDAWAAFGLPDVGASGQELFENFAGALGGAALESEFRRQTGLDLQDDVFGWIGDVAVHVTGVGMEGLRGALVIEVTDSDRATGAFGKLTGLLRVQGGVDVQAVELEGAQSAFEIRDPELPDTVVLARGEERVVVAFGRAAAESALAPADELSDSELWSQAEEALGDGLDPAFLLDFGKVLENVEAFGAGEDPEFAQAREYLDAFDVVASGIETDGDEQRSRFAFGLK
jgi:hypothetical protein